MPTIIVRFEAKELQALQDALSGKGKVDSEAFERAKTRVLNARTSRVRVNQLQTTKKG